MHSFSGRFAHATQAMKGEQAQKPTIGNRKRRKVHTFHYNPERPPPADPMRHARALDVLGIVPFCYTHTKASKHISKSRFHPLKPRARVKALKWQEQTNFRIEHDRESLCSHQHISRIRKCKKYMSNLSHSGSRVCSLFNCTSMASKR
jgi:hypothetical protein